MTAAAVCPENPNVSRAGGAGVIDLVPLAGIALMATVIWAAAQANGLTFAMDRLTFTILLAIACWALGVASRRKLGESAVARGLECFGLMVVLSLLASITSAAVVPATGPLIDPALIAMDAWIVPALSWREMLAVLAPHEALMQALSYIYVSMNWQPLAYLGLCMVTGDGGAIRRLAALWCIGVVLCVIGFYWLPAIGPYPWYGLDASDVPGSLVALPFESVQTFTALRDGTQTVIGAGSVTGLVCTPSFHASAAVMLASCWWRAGRARWPFAALNALMFFSAIPIGGHYYIDVIAGGIVACIAIAVVNRLADGRGGASRRSDPAAHGIAAKGAQALADGVRAGFQQRGIG